MKKNRTARALLMSALSLLLCVSMLVGSTFAWFTDSVVSANNIIKSGNLDVELYYQLENQDTWTKVAADTNVFMKDALWEPGHTEVVKLKVVNEGTLALKYQLGVNVVSETGSVSVLGNDFLLSDFIKFAVLDEPVNGREQAVAEAEKKGATPLKTAYNSQVLELLPKTGDTESAKIVTMVVYMPTTVDNAANYAKDAVQPVINLGINLFATQLMSEDDSFGNDYDKDAWHNAMKVSTAAELTAAVKAVEDGGTIGLLENITFDEDSAMNSSGTWYEGVIFDGDKSFTIDLNGKTITNDSAVNDYLVFIKNNGSKPNTITFKNGTLEAASSAYSAIATASSNGQKITINLENVAVKGNNSNGAVIKARGGSELNVKAGTVITGANNYVGIECVGNASVVNVYEGAEIYQNGTSSYVGSLVGVSNNGTVNVYGGKGKSAIGCFIAMTSGGTINVYGGEWIANTDGTVDGSNKGVLIAQSEKGAKSIVNVYGGTFKGGYNCYGAAAGDAQINIAGGTYNAAPTNYVAAGYKAVENADGTYSVIFPQESFDSLIDNAGENATIEVPVGNFKLPSMAEKEGVTIVGAADGSTVIGGENASTGFGGNFGKGNTYKNLTFTGTSNGVRYSYGKGGTVTFDNCTFAGDSTYGFHIDESNGATFIFNNCTFSGFNAFAGDLVKVTFNNCTFLSNGNYGHTNIWSVGEFNNCTWGEGATYGTRGDGVIYIDGAAYVTDADSLATAVANGATNILLADGEYDVKNCGGKTLTISGSKNAVLKLYNEGEDGCDYGFGGPEGVGNVTFNGLTIDTTANTGNYKGYAYMKGTFNDCNFVGAYSLNNHADFVFNRCTFDFKNGYFWTWGAKSVSFDGCIFNGNSKTILAHGSAATVININDCTFAATEKGYTGAGDNTAVVEMDPISSNTYTINFTGENTKTEHYAGWTRVKDGTTGHIVNGLN